MNIDLPKIGFRNIKTGIAVFLCLILFKFINRGDSLMACMASILCMGDTMESSLESGEERIVGTILGGIASIFFLYTVSLLPNVESSNPIVIAIGVSFIIYISNVFKVQNACSICCMVYISIMLNYSGSGASYYVVNRTLDTLIGVIIAVIVNYSIKVPTKEEDSEYKEDADLVE